MKLTWDELRNEYDGLVEMLAPWPRLTSSEEIGSMLEVSGAYVRMLRSASTKKPSEMPPEKICNRVVKLKEYVKEQVNGNGHQLIQLGNRLAFPRDTFDPSQKVHFVSIDGIGHTAEPVPVEISGEVRGYWVYAPGDWIKNCLNRECRKQFVTRYKSNYCQPECRRVETNRRRREKRASE